MFKIRNLSGNTILLVSLYKTMTRLKQSINLSINTDQVPDTK